ncbi:tubulintyrosine ligase family [Chrysochromulina tobinii]|uniref:Tubulintyrosine ligase family n=1 Tax=Chrysochromulina tobinii TaxID=1460289 RepID=A0A0M0JFT3_9EUKA|nr:tubulintyrosine ligase family [Chrysochromulina tobinii]|eukprot:KOO25315.1 tubulintyrosine ligase family [Chrysochromulina sp. CCMP291]
MGVGDMTPASWTARLPTSAVLARAVVEAVLSELQAAFCGGASSAARCIDREGGSSAAVDKEGGEATGDGDDGNDGAAELRDRTAATATPRTSAATPPAIGGAIGSAWILKAMNMSRGRGITIESELGAILERLFEREHKMIAQRYVDRPLLIERRKFDMRQWVLVTSINPLVVWRYSHYYLRFSSREYNDDLADRVTHLTNQSIQKKCEGYGTAIEGNMWSREQFHSFLTAQHGPEAGARTAAAVEARMSAVVGDTMRAVCDVIEPRAASFELYGFDLMLDAQYGVWLLEVNSSPDMSRNAAPLRAIVDQGLDDLLNVVLELQHKRTSVKQLAAERETREAPCWRLAYKGRALEERELLRRRFRKKCGADSLAVALAATSAAGSAAALPVEGGSSSSGTKRESKPVGLWK